jgi:hypothetical protein
MNPKTLGDRLREHSKPNPDTGCVEWTGYVGTGHRGYGHIRIAGRMFLAHRISWELTNGPIPNGLCVCHKCDNRRCINPEHLFLGTYRDNTIDAARKGRHKNPVMRGEKSPSHRLSGKDVIEIRASNERTSELAARYGVCQAHILAIKNRLRWRHI